MTYDKTVQHLEDIGYFGQLDENLTQRLKNGFNNVLGSMGNSRAQGKLEIGQLMIGLEKEYKRWLGANGIKRPTRRDFNRFLGSVENEYGVRFGPQGISQAPTPAPAAATPSQPTASPKNATQAPASTVAAPATASTPANNAPKPAPANGSTVQLTPDNPTITLTPGAPPTPQLISNGINNLKKMVRRNVANEATVKSQIGDMLAWAERTNQMAGAISGLSAFANEQSGSPVGAWIKDAISSRQAQSESRSRAGVMLAEADTNLDEPFSMSDARRWFQQIARHSYNNATTGNPAAAGNQSSDQTASPAVSTSTAPTGKNSGQGTKILVNLDTLWIENQLMNLGVRTDALREFMDKNEGSNPTVAGAAMARDASTRINTTNAAAVLFIYLKALRMGSS